MYGKLLMMIDSQSGLFVMAASTSLYSYIARNLSYDWIDLHLKKSGHLRRSYAYSEMLSGKQ
ncbi:hypothetical protein ACIAIL_28960 [Raoultella ornithinolytica]|uniref:hypothetical protein n=1 Tax=Raoultella ornithinolytica TaxID=54291 RepID=UPI003D6DB36A